MGLVIGLIYDHNENWIAGTYYIENLISALRSIRGEKPLLKIYTQKEELFNELRQKTNYPHMAWVRLETHLTIVDRIINKISTLVTGKHWSIPAIDTHVGFLFTDSDSFFFDKIKERLFWIPDFQEKYYPIFFTASQILYRKKIQRRVVKEQWPVVFSSKQARDDFEELYPNAKNQTFVMPFAVTLPSLEGINVEEIKRKYAIKEDYFLCSNQFWKHKNHKIVLEALLELSKRETTVKILFTGKPYDFRSPGFYEELVEFVERNDLRDKAVFLGFIERKEQLILMKNCIAVIQPSLFEGWSTVVEDAKALSIPLIVSDIPVHREQLEGHSFFFEKDNAKQLADKIMEMLASRPKAKEINYQNNIDEFGQNFLKVARQIIKQ